MKANDDVVPIKAWSENAQDWVEVPIKTWSNLALDWVEIDGGRGGGGHTAPDVTPISRGAVGWMSARAQPLTDGQTPESLNAVNMGLFTHGTPTYRTGVLNGLAGIETRPGSWFTSTDPLLNLGPDFTVMTVLQTGAGNGDGMAWMFGEAATMKRRALWCQQRTSFNFSGYDSNVVAGTGGSSVCVVTVRRSGGVVVIRRNGLQIGTGSPSLQTYSYNGFSMGANVSGSEPYSGVTGELAMWNRAATDDEIAAVEAQWMSDYAIT